MRSMVVYGSFLDATRDMSAKAFKEFWIALLEYGIDMEEPGDMSKPAQMAFSLAKPVVDANLKRRKKDYKNTIANNCEQLQTIANNCKQLSNDGDGDVDVDGDVDTIVDGEGEGEPEGDKPASPSKKFKPPSLDEVREYCRERRNQVDPETFVDFYTANGWVQGKGGKPIRDWKACVRTWERRDAAKGRPARKTGWSGMNSRDYDFDAIEAALAAQKGVTP